MSKRFERLSRNVEAAVIGAILIVIAYFVSRFVGGSVWRTRGLRSSGAGEVVLSGW